MAQGLQGAQRRRGGGAQGGRVAGAQGRGAQGRRGAKGQRGKGQGSGARVQGSLMIARAFSWDEQSTCTVAELICGRSRHVSTMQVARC